ncbi:MAG TPA: hypothetical protein VK420_13460, partial [Longimicrobium sp.]|nr:hypothetical protein [Longimicrobium sp.]
MAPSIRKSSESPFLNKLRERLAESRQTVPTAKADAAQPKREARLAREADRFDGPRPTALVSGRGLPSLARIPSARGADTFEAAGPTRPTVALNPTARATATASGAGANEGQAAAQRVNDAYRNAPEDERARIAAETLQREAEALKDKPDALRELYAGSRDTINAVAEDLGRRVREDDDGETEDTLRALSASADLLGADATKEMGAAIARALPDQDNLNQLDDGLHDLAEDGLGLNLTTAVVDELGKLGKSEAANELTDVLTEGLSQVRGDFESAQEKVDELNKELAYMVQSYGDLLTDDQLQNAIDDFKSRHAEDYDALERQAEKFTGVLDSVARLTDPNGPAAGLSEDNRSELLEEARKATVNVFPRLGDTVAGSEAISDAVEAQGRGEPTFLDQVTKLTEGLTEEEFKDLASDTTEAAGFADLVQFKQGVAETMFKAATLRIATHPSSSDALVEGLKKSAGFLGVEPAKLQTMLDDVTALASETDPARIQQLQNKIKGQQADLEFLSPSTRAGQAFGAFATVLGVVGAKGALENWDQLALKDKVAAIGGALDTGLAAFQTISGVAGRAASVASVAGAASGVLGGLGVVLDGISAVGAFKEGKYADAAGYSATAIGGAILTAAAFSNAVPVAGQIAAGVLIAAGFGLHQWQHVQDANKHEGPAQDFLEGAGLSSKLAEELSNHTGNGEPAGPALVAVAKSLGIEP